MDRTLAGVARLLAISLLASSLHAIARDCPGPQLGTDPQVLAVRSDAQRARTWILASDGLYLHAPYASPALRRFALPGWTHAIPPLACPPDVVVDSTGEAIVSNNITARVWRVHAERGVVETIDVTPSGETEREFGFTALQRLPDGKWRARSTLSDASWEIDLAAGTALRAHR